MRQPQMLKTLLCVLLTASLKHPLCAAEGPLSGEANVMIELSFEARRAQDDPFNTITLDLVFNGPDGRTMRVPAFWAGGKKWRARFASAMIGTHQFRTECSDTDDPGLHDVTGTIQIKTYTGNNPFYKHGPLQVAADRRYLQHADGTPFFWL